jgi:pimeloyl-ACP methyl ester carboxylesterase
MLGASVQEADRLQISATGGLQLVAEAWGPRDAAPVIFLHGGGQTRHSWQNAAKSVASRGWRGITVDMRGHGDTGWAPDRSYEFQDFVSDVAAIVAAQPLAPVLVGASLGGIAALLACARLPGNVAALVMVDVALTIEPKGEQRVRSFMAGHAQSGFATLEEAARAVADYLPNRSRSISTKGLRKNLREGPDGRWYWHWDPVLLDHLVRSRPSHDAMVAAARAIDLPTLLVRGGLSDIVDHRGVAEFLEHVPHAEFAEVSGAAHMIAGDDNDRFNDVIADFLARLPSPPPVTTRV